MNKEIEVEYLCPRCLRVGAGTSCMPGITRERLLEQVRDAHDRLGCPDGPVNGHMEGANWPPPGFTA